MTVFRCPAALAAHVACARRIHQDKPGNVAAILFGVFLRLLEAAEAALVSGIRQERFEDIGVAFADQALEIMCPLAVRLVGDHVETGEGLGLPDRAVDLLHHIDKRIGDVANVLCLTLFDERIQHGLKGFALCCVGDLLCCVHVVTLPFRVRAKRTFSIRRKGRDPFPRLPVRRSSGAFPCARRAVR